MQTIANLRRDEIALDYFNANDTLLEINDASQFSTSQVCIKPGQTIEVVAQVSGKE